MLQTNVYNGLDTRVGSTTNSVANTYLRDGAYVTDAVLKDSTATFTPGVSERRGATTTFSHSGLKNADAQTGVSQTVAATQQYDAFGNLASSTGTWLGQFGYGGGFGYQQDATGLKLLGHRYYDASTGRFLTRDPIKDGRNWYVYVGTDPVNYADPSGLFRVGDYEFNRESVLGGLKTSIAALGTSASLGLWDGGAYKHEPGFHESVASWDIATAAIGGVSGSAAVYGRSAASGARATWSLKYWKYPNTGGVGIILHKNGVKTGWRLDYHSWKGKPAYMKLHYHRPPRKGKEGTKGEATKHHRPWENGW